jgi:hypothetical protein
MNSLSADHLLSHPSAKQHRSDYYEWADALALAFIGGIFFVVMFVVAAIVR